MPLHLDPRTRGEFARLVGEYPRAAAGGDHRVSGVGSDHPTQAAPSEVRGRLCAEGGRRVRQGYWVKGG
eukprot:27741-Chlamydomonas_euryale.AAC.1